MTKKTRFKGLEIADMDFNKKVDKCSQCMKENCGLRDCMLEVYNLGSEVIYAGGLCPKGNTNNNKISAVNYVKQYNDMLNEKLSHITVPLDYKNNAKILIPRSLTFLDEKGILYASIYKNLGFDVSVSPPSNEEIATLGKNFSHSESCYPTILAHGHAAFLKNNMGDLDKILLLNAISSEKKQYKYCPYVASSGYVIKGNLELRDNQVLLPIVYFNNPDYPLDKSIKKDLDRIFEEKKYSKRDVRDAVKEAEKKQHEFLEEVYETGDEIISRLKRIKEPIFVGVGRGYTLFDDKASSKVHELFAVNGLNFVPSFFLRPEDIDIDNFAENMYWIQGRNMLRTTVKIAGDPNLHYVRMTNFNCGSDSLLHYHENDVMKRSGKPALELETDGHNSNAQFGTRIMANFEVVKKYSGNGKSNLVIIDKTKIKVNDLEKRILGVSYMGDGTDILISTFKAAGLKAEAIPSQTNESIELAKKFVGTNVCRPFSFQVGDQLAWLYSLKEKGIDPNNEVATFLPKAKGPCRFGQYSVILRKLFDENGFGGVPLIDTDSEEDYQNANIGNDRVKIIVPLLFKGVFANDILQKALLRTRPYEKNKGDSDMIYGKAHKELSDLVEQNPSVGKLQKFMYEQARQFENIEKIDIEKPLVLLNGEIFVRCNEKSNQDSIKILEENGLETTLEPISNWFDYINTTVIKEAWNQRDFSQLKKSIIKRAYMKYTGSKLFKPFKEYLNGREFHDTMHVIEDSNKAMVFSPSTKGEAALSIGEAFAFINGNLEIDGIYHVGPFGCMQETVATSRIQALIREKRKNSNDTEEKLIPFMNAVFGESTTANLDASVALFAENCRIKKALKNKKK